jgi:hypothetical protein
MEMGKGMEMGKEIEMRRR